MGQNDRNYSRAEAKKAAAQDKRRLRNFTGTYAGTADWGSVDGTLLTKAVAASARLGGALRLGYTRDGGAYAIGVYGDGEPYTIYIPPDDSIEDVLKGIIEDYE